jgi:hypothetical protein
VLTALVVDASLPNELRGLHAVFSKKILHEQPSAEPRGQQATTSFSVCRKPTPGVKRTVEVDVMVIRGCCRCCCCGTCTGRDWKCCQKVLEGCFLPVDNVVGNKQGAPFRERNSAFICNTWTLSNTEVYLALDDTSSGIVIHHLHSVTSQSWLLI